ncbi:MAG: type II toxin-antitoxin system RelE/ParE family toxin [Planctomycetaceae bacterium]|nr:type II toxin-antitoxin system RelE/ParE family toxin [Planctomycetaceae bacterium]MBT6157112.1 type II toxin-antitoxin system RelE/ParE family toxin [Planctomycetaceae bacterium]MBT6487172.1 type II toxin-antitoxin system RelE/ParE family toxin [Planctomycetaceae bacterium]MBT6497771.1 type II toxin-antitoxin system RelE/ParE family toxin [Planctomycetaceae bacterium]
MSLQLRFRRLAEADIDASFLYICSDNSDAAFRFLDAIQRTADILCEIPDMGIIWEFADSRIPTTRVCPVRGFRNYLVFYQTVGDAIDIVRVLHGSRDIEAVFSSEP